jgi:glycine dehydrogenase subunit 2
MGEALIFEKSRPGRRAFAQAPAEAAEAGIPAAFLRDEPALLPEVSELQVVRHFTRLSQENFSIDTQFYPLGSCTMKYNPRACNALALLPGFMHGELAGVAMIRAYHVAHGDHERDEIIVPDAAHGTNPATAMMCGCIVREVPTGEDGDIDIEALKKELGPRTAGIMLTNPSTLGVFERRIMEIQELVHDAGGLLYYDGANLNAILGKVRPGDMGFDVIHLNLHKTFSTPHGGGGPGSGAVGVGARLLPFLPVPLVGKTEDNGEAFFDWLTEDDFPQSIGRLSAFMGNAGVLLRAYVYMRMIGRDGMRRVAEFATLNANYMQARLRDAGFELAFPQRRAGHEFIITLKKESRSIDLAAMDVAKVLLDHGFHAPTTYFPLLVPECLLIEPTETESKETLDRFIDAMIAIAEDAKQDGARHKEAPYTMPVRRLDDVKAARTLDLAYKVRSE